MILIILKFIMNLIIFFILGFVMSVAILSFINIIFLGWLKIKKLNTNNQFNKYIFIETFKRASINGIIIGLTLSLLTLAFTENLAPTSYKIILFSIQILSFFFPTLWTLITFLKDIMKMYYKI